MQSLARPWLGLTAIVVAASALLAVGTTKVHEWVVQTDEMLYVKLARHMATTGSPLPTLHGEHVGFLGVVYPIVLAPFYGGLDNVAAFNAAHAVNAVLFASAAIPALPARTAAGHAGLGARRRAAGDIDAVGGERRVRDVGGGRLPGLPLGRARLLRLHRRALARARTSLAALALALAFFTRPQFLFLAAVLPLAAVIAVGPRPAFRQHRVLAIVYAVGLVVVALLAALGQAHRLLGDYGVTATQGSLLPAIAWKSAAIHLDVLAVGLASCRCCSAAAGPTRRSGAAPSGCARSQ